MILKIENLCVNYGNIEALRDLNMEVGEREIVALIGNNGAGKTTTLRAISGLLPLRKGSIKFLGEEISSLKPHKIARMGVIHVPEGRHVFYKFTVKENLLMGAYTGRDKQKKKQNLEHVLEIFPILKERINQYGGTLSGGEQQMLVVGRALMAEPKILLLDEPSLGLAPLVVDVIADNIERIAKEGIPILLVEQNANLALELSHRAYVLETGSLLLSGNSRDIRQNSDVQRTYLGIS